MKGTTLGAPPPLLLGAGILFWGWQTGRVALALPLALVLEAAPYLPWRWEVSDRDFNRISDLSNVLFAGLAVYLFVQHGAYGIFAIGQWLAVILFPLVTAQCYSTRRSIGLGALFLSVRRAPAPALGPAPGRLDLRYPYLAACIVAAACAPPVSRTFYPVLVVLCVWALAAIRPRRHRLAVWGIALGIAAALGYAGQMGLRALQLQVEEAALAWFEDRQWAPTDPFSTTTAIGHLGRLKLSERVVFYVSSRSPARELPLLRQASYQHYRSGRWLAGAGPFRAIERGPWSGSWRLAAERPPEPLARLTVSGLFGGGSHVLPLPGGTRTLEHLLAPALHQNPYGAVELKEGPGFLSYRALYGQGSVRDRAPEPGDLRLPERERSTLENQVQELGLAVLDARSRIEALQEHFAARFRYALYSPGWGAGASPLSHFLQRRRTGHCEYFASATVLLLRAAGTPARYATGYALREPNPVGDGYVVRRRHAHAWALAWVDGSWQDVDTTPAVWAHEEARGRPWWAPIHDLWYWSAYVLHRWRAGDAESSATNRLGWLLVPLTVLLGWRLYHRRSRRPATYGPTTRSAARARRGADSPFYAIARRLERGRVSRGQGEALSAWLNRLPAAGERVPDVPELHRLLAMHYRYRFDPKGLTPQERAEFKTRVQAWLRRASGLDSATPGAQPKG